MSYSKEELLSKINETPVVPLFTHDDSAAAADVIDAAYRGGIRVFEFTNRRKNSFEVFRHLLKHVEKYNDLALGIGTVMDGETTRKFIDAGAHFIISPILKTEMGKVCDEYNKAWIPGCATLTEIVTAMDHGAPLVKLFPGAVLGPGFVSAVMPVVPTLKLMITGGVEPNEKSLSAWFNAGAFCVGLGSQLFSADILSVKNWSMLERRVADLVQIAKAVRLPAKAG